MARSWKDVKTQANLDPTLVAEARAALEARIEGYNLAEARKRRSLTQRQVAKLMQVSQARVSKIERGELHRAEVETLQAYIQALGGTLELVANFGAERLTLTPPAEVVRGAKVTSPPVPEKKQSSVRQPRTRRQPVSA